MLDSQKFVASPLYISQVIRKENVKPDIDEDDQEADIESCERNGKLIVGQPI